MLSVGLKTAIYGVSMLFLIFNISMIVCLCASRRKDKNLRQGFYVLFIAVSVVDCLQLIAVSSTYL